MSNNVIEFPLKRDLIDSVNALIHEGIPVLNAVTIVMGAFTEENFKDNKLNVSVEEFGLIWLSLYKEFLEKQ